MVMDVPCVESLLLRGDSGTQILHCRSGQFLIYFYISFYIISDFGKGKIFGNFLYGNVTRPRCGNGINHCYSYFIVRIWLQGRDGYWGNLNHVLMEKRKQGRESFKQALKHGYCNLTHISIMYLIH